MVSLLFIGFVVLLFWCFNLQGRVNQLELKNQHPHNHKEKAHNAPPVKVIEQESVQKTPFEHKLEQKREEHIPPVAHIAPAPLPHVVRTQPSAIPHVQAPSKPDPILAWFAHNTLIKIGSFLFFLGAVWFVSYAISQGWISPLARILAGMLLGVVVCAVGFWRRHANSEHYLVLTTLGVGITIASIYTGQFLFSLFIPSFALFLLVVAIGYAVFVSFATKKEWLCVVSATASFLAPLLVNVPDLNHTHLLLYLLGISVAFLTVVFWTHWRSVTFTLVLGSLFFLVNTYADSSLSSGMLWMFVLLFTTLFYGASTVSMVRSNTPSGLDLVSLSIVSGALVCWISALTEKEGALTFAFAFVAAVTGFACHALARSEKVVAVYAGLSLVLILMATSFVFDDFALTMMYTLEIGVAILLAIQLRLSDRVVRLVSWAFVLPVCVSFADMFSSEWSTSVFHPSALALYILTVVTLGVSAYALISAKKYEKTLYQVIGIAFLELCWMYAHVVAFLVCGTLFTGDIASIMRYVSWTCISLGMIAYVVGMRLPTQMLHVALLGFILPIFTSLFTLDAHATSWVSAPYLGLYFMTIVSLAMSYFLLLYARKYEGRLPEGVGIAFLELSWVYAHIVTFLVCSTVFVGESVAVMRYVSWTCISLGMIAYVVGMRLSSNMLFVALLGFVLPVLTSFFALDTDATSWASVPSLGLYFMTAITLGMSAWLVARGLARKESGVLVSGGIALALGWVYAVTSLSVFWGALPIDSDAIYVLKYISWSILSVLLVILVRMLHAPATWTPVALSTLLLPFAASLASFFVSDWRSSLNHPHAWGLYFTTISLLLIGFALHRLSKIYMEEKETLTTIAKAFFVLFGVQCVGVVWLVTDALFESADTSVSVALLVYTLSGLSLYTIGRVRGLDELRYAGITLLSGVVVRLLVVDVWRMEILGRIVTFLGVGLLFILTALFEKPFEKLKKTEGEK